MNYTAEMLAMAMSGSLTVPTRQPKSVKLNAKQMQMYREKRMMKPEQKAEFLADLETRKYQDDKLAKKLRKQDVRECLAGKNTRPKGAYYDPEVKVKAEILTQEQQKDVKIVKNTLANLFKIDENQSESFDDHRIQHFGGSND